MGFIGMEIHQIDHTSFFYCFQLEDKKWQIMSVTDNTKNWADQDDHFKILRENVLDPNAAKVKTEDLEHFLWRLQTTKVYEESFIKH